MNNSNDLIYEDKTDKGNSDVKIHRLKEHLAKLTIEEIILARSNNILPKLAEKLKPIRESFLDFMHAKDVTIVSPNYNLAPSVFWQEFFKMNRNLFIERDGKNLITGRNIPPGKNIDFITIGRASMIRWMLFNQFPTQLMIRSVMDYGSSDYRDEIPRILYRIVLNPQHKIYMYYIPDCAEELSDQKREEVKARLIS